MTKPTTLPPSLAITTRVNCKSRYSYDDGGHDHPSKNPPRSDEASKLSTDVVYATAMVPCCQATDRLARVPLRNASPKDSRTRLVKCPKRRPWVIPDASSPPM